MSKEKKDHVDYCLLGQRVRRARMKLNLTQEVLAEKVGVSIPTISHIETGTNKVSLELFVSIANALNVTPDELIMDSVPKLTAFYMKDIQEELKDCFPAEYKILTEMLASMKAALRRYPRRNEDE